MRYQRGFMIAFVFNPDPPVEPAYGGLFFTGY